jgi:hypothetical protein
MEIIGGGGGCFAVPEITPWNEACSKSPYLIIEFWAGIYCVQRFYPSNMLQIPHLKSFVTLFGLTFDLGFFY